MSLKDVLHLSRRWKKVNTDATFFFSFLNLAVDWQDRNRLLMDNVGKSDFFFLIFNHWRCHNSWQSFVCYPMRPDTHSCLHSITRDISNNTFAVHSGMVLSCHCPRVKNWDVYIQNCFRHSLSLDFPWYLWICQCELSPPKKDVELSGTKKRWIGEVVSISIPEDGTDVMHFNVSSFKSVTL